MGEGQREEITLQDEKSLPEVWEKASQGDEVTLQIKKSHDVHAPFPLAASRGAACPDWCVLVSAPIPPQSTHLC